MKRTSTMIWTLIAVCFLALVACAHATDRTPANDTQGVRSGTSSESGLSPTDENILQRNHGGGRTSDNRDVSSRLMRSTSRAPASAPLLAGFAPMIGASAQASNVQPSSGWFLFAVVLIFALIYAVRRSNARPDEQEPKIRH